MESRTSDPNGCRDRRRWCLLLACGGVALDRPARCPDRPAPWRGRDGSAARSSRRPRTATGRATRATRAASRYSPLDQITAANFNDLEVAWRFKTDSLGTRPEYKLEGTPLVVNGILYTTAGTRRSVIALDAATGELLWVHRYPEGTRGANAPRQLSGRGLAYWTDGRGDERIIYFTPGYRMIALDAKTGQPVKSFGKDGIVDLKVGAVFGNNQQIDLETGEIGIHSTPVVVKDVVLVGSSMKEGMTVTTHNNTKGLARGFDARTGKLLWTFNTIPRPGEFGNDTWLDNSWAINGNAGIWTQISVDEELGLVYLPVETPTSDFYGGKRPGNNLFGESLVCVDLATGKTQVALPVRAPSDLERRHVVGAAHRRRDGRRPARARSSRCRASRRGCTCSIASPANRSGRSRRKPCRRATCPASGTRRRSRIRPRR